MNNDVDYLQSQNKFLKKKLEELTPGTRAKMRKIKSEEDFVKLQVPWIL